ncbi:MAG: hypothetical protein MUP24_10230 [Gillisia sp.]|nr:hypothetical protein [Gillisia sp.]
MLRKKIAIGFLIGIFANAAGIFLYITFFSEMDLEPTLTDAVRNRYLGKIIALGALLNFFPFFVFLKKNQIYHARGVVLATVLAAILIAISMVL